MFCFKVGLLLVILKVSFSLMPLNTFSGELFFLEPLSCELVDLKGDRD